MSRKTETLYGTAELKGDRVEDAANSFRDALIALENEGVKRGRVVLFDTLNVTIDHDREEELTLTNVLIHERVTIVVNASAVRQ